MNKYFLVSALMLFLLSKFEPCNAQDTSFNLKEALDYCDTQARKTVRQGAAETQYPVRVNPITQQWIFADKYDWRSGFWPGILWLLFESNGDPFWKQQAMRSTKELEGILNGGYYDHDLGFQLFCSFGNGFRLTNNSTYKKILLRAADSLATLYNPKVGTILSWPNQVKKMNWPHNTIMDNMINLELLLWASKNGGKKEWENIALTHARTTMRNHFRPDYTSYHVVVYDTISGKKIKGVTHQGFADESMWARGQAWAIYGFTMLYRETGEKEFLDLARKVTDVYLSRLPDDLIAYWDFMDPEIPKAPKDASAAAIAASGMLELASLSRINMSKNKYFVAAKKILAKLSSAEYQSGAVNNAFLLHSTGHKPAGKDIDVPLIYADYYYLEALLRLQKIEKKRN